MYAVKGTYIHTHEIVHKYCKYYLEEYEVQCT